MLEPNPVAQKEHAFFKACSRHGLVSLPSAPPLIGRVQFIKRQSMAFRADKAGPGELGHIACLGLIGGG